MIDEATIEQATSTPATITTPADDGTAPPERLDVRLLAVTRSFVRSVVSFGGDPKRSFERVSRALCSRVVKHSIEEPLPIRDLRELEEALSKKTSLPFDSTGAAVVTKAVMTRVGPLKFLARRTPWLVAASAVPDMYSALARGRDEVAMVSSFLIHQSGGTAAAIDPERLRRVTVQLLQRRAVAPEIQSDDGDLVSSWIRRAVKSALPFVKAGVTRHSKSIAAAAARVDPASLLR